MLYGGLYCKFSIIKLTCSLEKIWKKWRCNCKCLKFNAVCRKAAVKWRFVCIYRFLLMDGFDTMESIDPVDLMLIDSLTIVSSNRDSQGGYALVRYWIMLTTCRTTNRKVLVQADHCSMWILLREPKWGENSNCFWGKYLFLRPVDNLAQSCFFPGACPVMSDIILESRDHLGKQWWCQSCYITFSLGVRVEGA